MPIPQFAYRKPLELCEVDLSIGKDDRSSDLIGLKKKEIENFFSSQNLRIRRAVQNDTMAIVELRNRQFDTPNRYTPYWLYHLTSFGNSVVIENLEEELLGVMLEASYLDVDRTSYMVVIALDDRLKGKRVSHLLIKYVCLLAMERGARFSQGTIAPDNLPSLATFLNYSGAVLVDYQEDFEDFGKRFIFRIPLKVYDLYNNCFSPKSFQRFSKVYTDTILISVKDMAEIKEMYKKKSAYIVGVLKGDILGKQGSFFVAIPYNKLEKVA